MTLEQVYAAIGGDYKGVMERLPSADFVRRFALKFLQDDSFPNLKKALEEKDAPTAFRAAHTLKGVCQNLGFDALYVRNAIFSGRSLKAQVFSVDSFNDFYLLRSVVLSLSLWHTKTPHFLNSIPYCLTNGVQFRCTAGVFCYSNAFSASTTR